MAIVDEPAAELAMHYADSIDADPDQLRTLGPLLLAALVELGLTPKARAATMKGVPSEPAKSPLDELRARRGARQRDTTTVDTTAS
jgi:hypothetical protein